MPDLTVEHSDGGEPEGHHGAARAIVCKPGRGHLARLVRVSDEQSPHVERSNQAGGCAEEGLGERPGSRRTWMPATRPQARLLLEARRGRRSRRTRCLISWDT